MVGSLSGVLLAAGLVVLIIWLAKRSKHRKAEQKLCLDNFVGKQFNSDPGKKKDSHTPVAFELGTLPSSVRQEGNP